jgi:hypothetical protein
MIAESIVYQPVNVLLKQLLDLAPLVAEQVAADGRNCRAGSRFCPRGSSCIAMLYRFSSNISFFVDYPLSGAKCRFRHFAPLNG